MLNLRYHLLPYIYSAAWQLTKGSAMMRPLVMDFPDDPQALKQNFEYMFRHGIRVAPVTNPGISQTGVYLPKGADWYNFWTGEKFKGGKTIKTAAPRDIIPYLINPAL